jgi:hypothetical protein
MYQLAAAARNLGCVFKVFFYFREVLKLKIEKKDGRKLSAKKPDENVLKN